MNKSTVLYLDKLASELQKLYDVSRLINQHEVVIKVDGINVYNKNLLERHLRDVFTAIVNKRIEKNLALLCKMGVTVHA